MASPDDAEKAYARLWQLLWSCCDEPSPMVVWSSGDEPIVLLVLCMNCMAIH